MKVNQNPLAGSQTLGNQSTKQVDKAKTADKASDVKKVKAESTTNPNAPTASQVEISEQARLLRQANEAVHALPDARQDKIQDLKERIRAGTYKVDSASIADKLVEEHFLTDFGKNNA